MTLRIDRVETEMDVAPENPAVANAPAPPALSAADDELREHLRPIVLDILEEELQRLRMERA